MSDQFIIKQNDTLPTLTAVLKDASGTVVDLTNCTVTFKMGSEVATKTSAAATITSATQGGVSYQWTASDTDTAGIYLGEFEVVKPTGLKETFPNGEPFRVIVRQDFL
tara:strand:- start:249 stop:572 length:324 start_codon:yes stop_codon:yes gene_type:complete